MDFHGITMKGPFLLEEVNSLPTGTEKRLVYYNGSVWFFDGSDWNNLLDADTLDGYDSTYFAISGHTHPYADDDHTHDSRYLNQSSNLSDVASVSSARNNLGLKNNAQVTYYIEDSGYTPNDSDGRPNGTIIYVKNE